MRSTVAVHLDGADTRAAGALKNIECCPGKLIGIVSAGNGSVCRLLLEGNRDRRQYIEHVLTFAAARYGS